MARRASTPDREAFAGHVGRCAACRKALADLLSGSLREGKTPPPDPGTAALARSIAGAAAGAGAVSGAGAAAGAEGGEGRTRAAAGPSGGASSETPIVRLRVFPGPRIEGADDVAAPRREDGEVRARVAVGRFRLEILAGRAGRRWTLRARTLEGPPDTVILLADTAGARIGARAPIGTTAAWPALPSGLYRLSALSREGAAEVEIEVRP